MKIIAGLARSVHVGVYLSRAGTELLTAQRTPWIPRARGCGCGRINTIGRYLGSDSGGPELACRSEAVGGAADAAATPIEDMGVD